MKLSLQIICLSVISTFAATTLHARGVTPVIVTEVAERELFDEVEALGNLRANESVTISSTVTELVEKIHFDDGQVVKQGDIIIEMDAAEELAQMVEEQSRLRQAERELKRAEELVESGAVSESALDEAQRDYDAANARITAIQSRIDQRILRAPFDGLTGLRMISHGALVQPGTMITTIDDTSRMKLDFSVPSVFLETLQVGLPVLADARAFPNKEFTGQINGIDSRIDPVTRSVMVRAIIQNDEGLLRPGLLMAVDLQKNKRTALTIPEEAVTLDGSKAFVWLVEQAAENKSIARKTQVELGARLYGNVEVLSGLSNGDPVITHGIDRVRSGGEIRVVAVDDGSVPISEILPKLQAPEK